MIANLQLICVQEHGGRPVLRQFRPNFGHHIQRYIRSKLESFGYLICILYIRLYNCCRCTDLQQYSAVCIMPNCSAAQMEKNMNSVAVG